MQTTVTKMKNAINSIINEVDATGYSNLSPQAEIENLMDETFGSMRGDDPGDTFYDYKFGADGRLIVSVFALGDIEKTQQIKNLKTFLGKARKVDGVSSISTASWEGDGSENTPYYIELTVTFGKVSNKGKSAVYVLAKKMFSSDPDVDVAKYEQLNATTERIVLTYGSIKKNTAKALTFKQAAEKLPGITEVKIAKLKSSFLGADRADRGYVEILITKTK